MKQLKLLNFFALLALCIHHQAFAQTAPASCSGIMDQPGLDKIQAAACTTFDADPKNSCAYKNYMNKQNASTVEKQAKDFEDKMAKLFGGPLPDSAKVDANIIKKIKDYSRLACAGGAVKIGGPGTIFEVSPYNRKEIPAPEPFTATKNNYTSDKSSYLKIKGSGCVPANDGVHDLMCTGAGYTQYISKALANAYDNDDMDTYLKYANSEADRSSSADVTKAAQDYNSLYGTQGDSANAANIAKMNKDATATYTSDQMSYNTVVDANGKKTRQPFVAHKKGDLMFPEIKAAEDRAVKYSHTANDDFFSDFDPKTDTGAYRYCPAPDQVTANPENKINPVELHEPCDMSVSGNYTDNIVDPKRPLTLDKTSDNKCIQEAIANGYQPSAVVIKTSSSSLNNTGDAAKQCCGKGFQCLSDARAESVKDKLPGLLEKIGFQSSDSTVITTNTKGKNGDGTSGPCAYTLEPDGKFPEKRLASVTKADLDKAKAVTLTVSFQKGNTPLPKQVIRQAEVRCQRIVFTCQ